MTVIPRDKQTFKAPKAYSVTSSDTESLHLGSVPVSDTESLNGDYTNNYHTYRPPPVRFLQPDDLRHIKRSCGKRKLRRYQNRCSLQTLNEEDEDTDFFVIMEPYASPFTRLLKDDNALKYWNEFIEMSDVEQLKIIESISNISDKITKESTKEGEKPGKLSARIRRTIKIKKNLSLDEVRECEDDLIGFFKAFPEDIYVRNPPTSFNRLLLHGIAQYHKLKSTSVQVDDGALSLIEVCNVNENWTPAEQLLTDFIKQLRKEM